MDGLELIRTLKEKNCPEKFWYLATMRILILCEVHCFLGAADYLLKIKFSQINLACLNKTVEKKDKVPRNWETEKKDQEEDISKLLLEFFQKDVKLSDYMGQHAKTRLAFMEASPSAFFREYLSNDAFSISGSLLRDMILDAVQGVLQPYILVLNDYSALVVFSQTELSDSEIKIIKW